MLSAVAVTMAAPESQQLGPFAVSFDMNTDLPHQMVTAEPIEAPTANIYSMQIATDNSTKAIITVSEYNSPIDSTLGLYKQISAMSMALIYFNTTDVQDRAFDGKEGFLLVCEPSQFNTAAPAGAKLYNAMYWLDSVGCECGPVSVGTTSVDITSSYPQDVTESLLSSLKIEKGQAATTSTPSGQILPPG